MKVDPSNGRLLVPNLKIYLHRCKLHHCRQITCDTKIFHQITSREDALILQSDLSLLEQWSKHWLLNFHPDKCHDLTLGKFDNIRHTHRYHINDTELEHVFKEKDLGITMDGDLCFEGTYHLKLKRPNVVMGQI